MQYSRNCLKIITLLWAVAGMMMPMALHAAKFFPLTPQIKKQNTVSKFMPLRAAQPKIALTLAKKSQNFKPMPRFVPIRKKAKYTTESATVEQEMQTMLEQSEQETRTESRERVLPFDSAQHQWPIEAAVGGVISSPYGYRIHPITKEYAFHAGLDIAAPEGTQVLASFAGTVMDTGYHQNLGQYVKLRHADESISLYGHLSKISVQKDQSVTTAQKIGEVGSTGRSTGPHLDYSLRRAGKTVDPMDYLQLPASQQLAFNTDD